MLFGRIGSLDNFFRSCFPDPNSHSNTVRNFTLDFAKQFKFLVRDGTCYSVQHIAKRLSHQGRNQVYCWLFTSVAASG